MDIYLSTPPTTRYGVTEGAETQHDGIYQDRMTQQDERDDEVVTLIPHFPSLTESLDLSPCSPGSFAAWHLAAFAGRLEEPRVLT